MAQRRRDCQAVGKDTSAATLGACRLILELAFDAARRTLAQQALALAVQHSIHGRAALVAARGGWRAARFAHRLVTTGPVAKNVRMFFCCVTTRGLGSGGLRGLLFLRGLGLVCLPLFTPLPFRLSMLPAPFLAGTAFLLALGRLPATQFIPAFRLLAVALVLPPGLELPAAVFAETCPPPQSPTPPAPGGRTALLGILNLSHGR